MALPNEARYFADLNATTAEADTHLLALQQGSPPAGGVSPTPTRKWTLAALKAYVKTYFDTLYVGLTGNQTIAGNKTFSGNLLVNGNTTLGDAVGDTVTFNAGGIAYQNSVSATRVISPAPAGLSNAMSFATTVGAADAGGTTNVRGYNGSVSAGGAANYNTVGGEYSSTTYSGTGVCAALNGIASQVGLNNTGSVTLARGFAVVPSVNGAGSVTTSLTQYDALSPSFTGAGTIANLYGFRAANLGHANVGTAVGFRVDDFSASTVMRGFQGAISAGAGKHNLYLDGTAVNYLNGSTGIGEASPDYKLDVNGAIGFTPGASVTPVDNGDVVFEFTNNTTLTVKAKGSDGTVRSGTITLA